MLDAVRNLRGRKSEPALRNRADFLARPSSRHDSFRVMAAVCGEMEELVGHHVTQHVLERRGMTGYNLNNARIDRARAVPSLGAKHGETERKGSAGSRIVVSDADGKSVRTIVLAGAAGDGALSA